MRWSGAVTTDAGAKTSSLVRELGIRFLRYGVPVHRTYLAPDRFDWIFADQTFSALRERRLGPRTVIGGRTLWTAARRKEVFVELRSSFLSDSSSCPSPFVSFNSRPSEMSSMIQRLRRSLDGLARAW